MPKPEPTLSERLIEHAQDKPIQSWTNPQTEQDKWDDRAQELMRAAAPIVAPSEQPEVADLLARAAELKKGCPEIVDSAEAQARDLYAHAAALVRLAEAQAKVAVLSALIERYSLAILAAGLDPMYAARKLREESEAALADAGGGKEVTG